MPQIDPPTPHGTLFDETLAFLFESEIDSLTLPEAGRRRDAYEALMKALPDDVTRRLALDFSDATDTELSATLYVASRLGYALRHVQEQGFTCYEQWMESAVRELEIDDDSEAESGLLET